MDTTRQTYRQTAVYMATPVTIELVGATDGNAERAAVGRAFGWFELVEETCSRFDPASELSRLSERVGEPVEASALLFEVVRFALEVARASDGAFDPTIGQALARRGFDRNHRTGKVVAVAPDLGDPPTYRDVGLDERHRTITLRRSLRLDLGAVAKGFAVDLAVKELNLSPGRFPGAVVDAGGDNYARGESPQGGAWRVGIRHPRNPGELADVLAVSDVAVCTSGDYERRAPSSENQHHILNPQTGVSPEAVAAVTVVAPTAMVADALATTAFVLGPARGLAFLQAQKVEGLIVTSALERRETPGFGRYRPCRQ
jgi:thiamine biosynthesis lipoprotein